MHITFLGSGSAFTVDNYQSNMLLTGESGKRMLFDCGGDIRWALREKELTALDIDAVYISHLHADHVGGLEYVAFTNYFVKTVKTGFKPVLYGNSKLLHDLWHHSLKGGLDSIQMMDSTLDTFFDVVKLPNSGSFDFDGIHCKTVQTVHVVADTTFVKSFGLMITTEHGAKVFITSDTQFAPAQLKDFIADADVVFHDCETAPFASGVHAHYEDLKGLPKEQKAKMYLYHWNGDAEGLPNAKQDGFADFVAKGQVFAF